MNCIKGYISIQEASYRWGGSQARPGSGVHGRSRKTRKSRPTRAFRNSAAIPAGQAPDRLPATFESAAKRK